MKILLTGGTGLIGRAFIDKFFKQHQITVLTRDTIKAKQCLPLSVTYINSLATLNNLDAFDAVINLAGEPIIAKRWRIKQKEIIVSSRWQTTKQLVALFASSNTPPDVFLSGSAIGIYGNRGDELLDENAHLTLPMRKAEGHGESPDEGLSVAERSQNQHSQTEYDFPTHLCTGWENIAKKAKPYTRVVLLRTGIVLAANGGAVAKMLLPFKCGLGGPIGNGGHYMSWIHYQDHINAMHYLLTEKSLSGAVNLVAPNPETNKRFAQTLAKALHRPAILPMPQIALKCLLGESACLLLDSQRVIPQKLLESGFGFTFPNLAISLC